MGVTEIVQPGAGEADLAAQRCRCSPPTENRSPLRWRPVGRLLAILGRFAVAVLDAFRLRAPRRRPSDGEWVDRPR